MARYNVRPLPSSDFDALMQLEEDAYQETRALVQLLRAFVTVAFERLKLRFARIGLAGDTRPKDREAV
ncbi:MAG: hypothetical protein AAF449_06930 [Myxococcota bacterium]